MPRLRLLRTIAFRIALIYVGLFGISVAVILGTVYYSTAGLLDRQTRQTVGAEIQGLYEQYRQRGLPGLVRTVQRRSASPRTNSLYLITDSSGDRVAGNLASWPDETSERNGWLSFELTEVGPADEGPPMVTKRSAQGQGFILPGGYRLLVGRDLDERRRFEERLTTSLLLALGLTIGLGTVGGVVISRNMIGRIDAINRTARRIMAGELHQRVHLRGGGDELDELAINLNAMLDRIEHLMGEMRHVAESIAHDLRTPLSRLRARLELALRDLSPEDTAHAALQDVAAEADRLLATFQALLAIAEIEAGHQQATFDNVDLADLVREMVELYEPVAEDRNQRLTTDLLPATVRGHRQLLAQALANLLDNAVKYTPEGGRIAVEVRPVPDTSSAELIVTDSGPGIPAADRERVLHRFVRLEESRSTAGNGLGLALVDAVARLHGATLELADAEPGLRVTLRMPNVA